MTGRTRLKDFDKVKPVKIRHRQQSNRHVSLDNTSRTSIDSLYLATKHLSATRNTRSGICRVVPPGLLKSVAEALDLTPLAFDSNIERIYPIALRAITKAT